MLHRHSNRHHTTQIIRLGSEKSLYNIHEHTGQPPNTGDTGSNKDCIM